MEETWVPGQACRALEQERERSLQRTMVGIKKKYGKNGIFRGMNLLEGAKTIERNVQVGGHRA